MMLRKCCTQYVSKFGKLSHGHRTGKGNAKECSNYYTIALISHTRNVMIKILQARLHTAVLLTTAKTWTQPTYPSPEGQMKKM